MVITENNGFTGTIQPNVKRRISQETLAMFRLKGWLRWLFWWKKFEPKAERCHSQSADSWLVILPAPWQKRWINVLVFRTVSITCCGSGVKLFRCVLTRLMSSLHKLSDPGFHAWRSDGGGGGGGGARGAGRVIVWKRESFTANRIEGFNHCKTPNSY